MNDRSHLDLGFATLNCGTRDLNAIRKCNISINESHEIVSSGLALYIKMQHAQGHSPEVIAYKVNELYVRHIDPETIDTLLEDQISLTRQINETGEIRISNELWVPESMYIDVTRMSNEDSHTIREFVSMKWHQPFELDVVEAILDHFEENRATDHHGRPVGDHPVPTQGTTVGELFTTPVTARTGTRRSSFTRAPPMYSPRPQFKGVSFTHPREIVVGNTHHPDSFREGTCPLPPPYAPPSYTDAVADEGATDRGPTGDSRSLAPMTTGIANRRGASIPPINVSVQRANYLEAVTGDHGVRQTLPDQTQSFDLRYPIWLPKQDYSPRRNLRGYGEPPSPALITATFLSFINQAALSMAFVEQEDEFDRPGDSPADSGHPGTPVTPDTTDNLNGRLEVFDEFNARLEVFEEELSALLPVNPNAAQPSISPWLDVRTPVEVEEIIAAGPFTLTRQVSVPDTRYMRRPDPIIPIETSTQQQRDPFDERMTVEVQAAIQQLEGLHHHFMRESNDSNPRSVVTLEMGERLLGDGWAMTEMMRRKALRGESLSLNEAAECRIFCEKVSLMATARGIFVEQPASLRDYLDAWDTE